MISAVDRLYSEISQPQPPLPEPTPQPTPTAPAEITRNEVDEILKRTRTATIDDLQFILDHTRRFRLTSGERNQIAVQLTLAIAQTFRPAPKGNPMLLQLGYIDTPVGLLANREWFDQVFRAGTHAIRWCGKKHRPPRCACWRDVRDLLWDARVKYGEKSAEAWSALRIWEMLEELEGSSRPEPLPGIIED